MSEERYARRITQLTQGTSGSQQTVKAVIDILREAHDEWTSDGLAMGLDSRDDHCHNPINVTTIHDAEPQYICGCDYWPNADTHGLCTCGCSYR